MSLSQYYQQQRQHQSEPLQLQQQALQPSQVSMSDISIGPNQAKSKTTFISYDKRVINETLLMYQLIQREHPDLWKEEIAYEAMSQKVQVSE